MNDIAIDAEKIGKEYRIGTRASAGGYVTLRDTVSQAVTNWARGRPARPVPKPPDGTFWALKDVSFQIKQGDIVGLLGRNGAGKSTLLKVLSRITEPTEGRATIRGRVASLLEVGTGFHPELTGRENIFLNGAILGMSRADIKRRFDEIVSFAEVEQFLETPVKRYSSGMYVRLAFAVAAHLETEILIIDEVLAVGDAEFQRKCMGKMGEVAHSGRTVLLVSHNMAIVEQTCGSAFLLAGGRIEAAGPAGEVVRRYLDASFRNQMGQRNFKYRNKGAALSIEGIDFIVQGMPALHAGAGDRCEFIVRYRYRQIKTTRFSPVILLSLYYNGQKIASLWTGFFPGLQVPSESGAVRCTIPKWPLRDGIVRVDIYTHVGPDLEDWIEEILVIESRDGLFHGAGPLLPAGEGLMFLEHSWDQD